MKRPSPWHPWQLRSQDDEVALTFNGCIVPATRPHRRPISPSELRQEQRVVEEVLASYRARGHRLPNLDELERRA
jgi:hypothetical protein